MAQELTDKIIRIVAETQRIPPEQVTLDATFRELGLDSLDAMNIVFAIESEFNINVPDEEVKNITTVRSIAERLGDWLAQNRGDEAAGGPD